MIECRGAFEIEDVWRFVGGDGRILMGVEVEIGKVVEEWAMHVDGQRSWCKMVQGLNPTQLGFHVKKGPW